MNIFQKVKGKSFLFLGKAVDIVLEIIIKVLALLVELSGNISKFLVGIFGMLGFLLVAFLFTPLGLLMLFNIPVIFLLILFVIFPIVGRRLIKFLNYIQETLTEFLYDRGDEILNGKKARFNTFIEYREDYKRREYEEYVRRQQEEYERQRKAGEDFTKRIFEEFFGGNFEDFSGRSGQYQGGNYQGTTMGYGFKDQYEKSCDILEVAYSSDHSTIKTAYRKKAKEYHPDLNKSEGATEMFQKVNNAYEFLTEENVSRYKNMN